MSYSDIDRYGDLWRVSLSLTASMDQAIVTPAGYLAGPENIGGIPTVNRRGGITILGVAAYLTSGAGAASITLRSVDPAYIAGQINNYDIWSIGCGATTTVEQSVTDCMWTLSPANTRISPSTTGANLQLVTSANVSAGFITVWGVYGQSEIGSRHSFSGSPAVYS